MNMPIDLPRASSAAIRASRASLLPDLARFPAVGCPGLGAAFSALGGARPGAFTPMHGTLGLTPHRRSPALVTGALGFGVALKACDSSASGYEHGHKVPIGLGLHSM